ncbi:MAG: rhodanese-like domain-containing protein [Deltaproteobacteria bacterium]|nr:rhodanese-like domain-containing protein [Deltaproteobacteria bacterium]MBI3076312.1 rhodanese-like domain-containing protein [Deltaproteobacteria bacterium]
MNVKEVSPREAFELMTSLGYTYLDVRSIPEFTAGHATGAVNIPLMHLDERSGQMVPNPEFLEVVQANFPPDTKLVIGCHSGGRSMHACQLLGQIGYAHVLNIRGGFGGAQDRFGRLVERGWAEAGLPVDQTGGEGISYESLAGKVKTAR